jgi:hypothetical protein
VLLAPGQPCYLFGSKNLHQSDTQMYVSNVALTSNVATLTVQIYGGEIPAAGWLVSVRQTASTSGLFNVNRVPITTVTIDSTGAGTIVFPLTHADVVSAANTGTAIAEVPEIGDTAANGASIACCVQTPLAGARTLPVAITFPTVPTTATVVLQGALHNIDSEFTAVSPTLATVAASAQTLGPFNQVTLQAGYFYRFLVSSFTGSGTIVAKIG